MELRGLHWGNQATQYAAGVLPVMEHQGALYVLLLQRAEDGVWVNPGGFRYAKEDPWGTAQREMAEETSQLLEPTGEALVCYYGQRGRTFHDQAMGDDLRYVLFVTQVERMHPVRLSAEHTDAMWVPVEELLEARAEGLHPGLQWVLQRPAVQNFFARSGF